MDTILYCLSLTKRRDRKTTDPEIQLPSVLSHLVQLSQTFLQKDQNCALKQTWLILVVVKKSTVRCIKCMGDHQAMSSLQARLGSKTKTKIFPEQGNVELFSYCCQRNYMNYVSKITLLLLYSTDSYICGKSIKSNVHDFQESSIWADTMTVLQNSLISSSAAKTPQMCIKAESLLVILHYPLPQPLFFKE